MFAFKNKAVYVRTKHYPLQLNFRNWNLQRQVVYGKETKLWELPLGSGLKLPSPWKNWTEN